MWKKIVLALFVVLLALLAFVALQPSAYRVARSAAVAAPPQVVYEQIADFRRWAAWSPWAKLDPAMAVDYGGPPLGVGATYHWKGNDKVGEGRMTVVDARPGELVAIQLDFIQPWESRTRTEFQLRPEAGGTRVSWVMSGENDFVGKAFATFVNLTLEQATGMALADTRLGRLCPEILEDIRKALESQKPTQRMLSFPWRSNRRVSMMIWLAPEIVDKQPIGIVGVVHPFSSTPAAP